MITPRAISAETAPGPLGFFSGVAALPRACAEILRTPELRVLSVVPTLVFLTLTAAFGALSVSVARAWLLVRLPRATDAFGRAGVGVAAWAFAALCALAGFYLALALAPALSAPALERIVARVERSAGAPPRTRLGFWRELACGLRSLAGAALFALAASSLLWLVGVLVPAATPVTVPLGSLLGAWLVAWGLLDYPLTLRGLGFRERLRLMRANLRVVTGFGAAFALCFWLPCCSVVLLPVGAVAAARLAAAILHRTAP